MYVLTLYHEVDLPKSTNVNINDERATCDSATRAQFTLEELRVGNAMISSCVLGTSLAYMHT